MQERTGKPCECLLKILINRLWATRNSAVENQIYFILEKLDLYAFQTIFWILSIIKAYFHVFAVSGSKYFTAALT